MQTNSRVTTAAKESFASVKSELPEDTDPNAPSTDLLFKIILIGDSGILA